MQTVFILQHSYERGDHDETKFIGAYSTREQAQLAINRLKDMNGFKYYPDAFHISEYELNKDHWVEGFVSLINIQTKGKDNSWITVQAELLPNDRYQIIEYYYNDSLGEFKHLDIVECENRDGYLYAVKLSNNI